MTELEKRILDNAKKVIPRLRERIEEISSRSQCRFITFPVYDYGLFDQLTYDKELKRFDHLQYVVGIKNGIILEGEENTGYYDKVELRKIDLTSIEL
jgi:hypothetical protein